MLTPKQTDVLIHWAATAMFVVLLVIACLLLYFTSVAMAGDNGGVVIDRITWVLERQKGALALLGTAATAVPALALGLANTPKGRMTRRGWIYVGVLVPTWVIATVGSFLMEPEGVNLGPAGMPTLVDSTALAISGFALTFLAAILGLKRVATANANAPPETTGAPPAANTRKGSGKVGAKGANKSGGESAGAAPGAPPAAPTAPPPTPGTPP
jgi:hypothetical protein